MALHLPGGREDLQILLTVHDGSLHLVATESEAPDTQIQLPLEVAIGWLTDPDQLPTDHVDLGLGPSDRLWHLSRFHGLISATMSGGEGTRIGAALTEALTDPSP